MSERRRREFASAILIDIRGRFLFQQRDNIPGILYAGKVGLFGGHREGDETYLQCVQREVHEETGYLLAADRFERMGSYSGVDPNGGRVVGEFFLARGIPVDALLITEGSLLIIENHELPPLMQRLAPSAWSAVRLFMNKQKP